MEGERCRDHLWEKRLDIVFKACLSSLVLFTVLSHTASSFNSFNNLSFSSPLGFLHMLVPLLEASVSLLPLGDSCSLFYLSLDVTG